MVDTAQVKTTLAKQGIQATDQYIGGWQKNVDSFKDTLKDSGLDPDTTGAKQDGLSQFLNPIMKFVFWLLGAISDLLGKLTGGIKNGIHNMLAPGVKIDDTAPDKAKDTDTPAAAPTMDPGLANVALAWQQYYTAHALKFDVAKLDGIDGSDKNKTVELSEIITGLAQTGLDVASLKTVDAATFTKVNAVIGVASQKFNGKA